MKYTPERLAAIYKEQSEREHGTIVKFYPEEGGFLEAAQDQQDADFEAAKTHFASLFPAVDPQPVERSEHFGWLDRHEAKTRGWNASVLDMGLDAGGYFVKVRMNPILHWDRATVTTTTDYFDEFYYVSLWGVEYLGGVGAPPDRPKMLFGD